MSKLERAQGWSDTWLHRGWGLDIIGQTVVWIISRH